MDVTGAIDLTPDAAAKIRDLRRDDPKHAFLRIYVAGRTCCAFQYGLMFDATTDETDTVAEVAGIPIAVDRVSAPYCEGAIVEWVDGPQGTGFLVRNPAFGGACGCAGGSES